MQQMQSWRLYVIVVVVWLLGFGVLQMLHTAQPQQITVGPGDGVYFAGMHAAEAQANSFRWTTAQSTVRVPINYHGMAVVAMRVLNQYPTADRADARIADGRHEIDITIPSGSIRVISMMVPSRFEWRWYVPLTITTSPKQFGDDPRQLGISINRVTVQPTRGAFGAHSYMLIMGVLLALGMGIIGRWVRMRDEVLALGLGGMTCIYYGLLIVFSEQLVPYLSWATIWVWLLVSVIGVARVSMVYDRTWHIKGIHLPILLGVWWWCMPIVQWVLWRDGMPIPPWQLYVAPWIAAVVLIAWAGYAVLRRRNHDRADWMMIGLLVCVGFGYAAWQYYEMLDKGSGDFGIWYDAARRWVFEGVLYKLDSIVDNPFAGYKRPPFYIMMFTPFMSMNELDLLNAYRLLNIVLLGVTGVLWYRLMQPLTHWWWVLVMLLLLNFQPLLDALRYGQTDIVMLCAFTLMWWFVQRGRDGWAGAIIAFLTSFKIYPIVLLTFWGAKQRWWAVGGFILGMLGWNAIAVVVMGWDLHVMFLRDVLPSIGGTTSWIENQTIAGFVTRFYEDESVMQLFATPGIARVASIISMILSAVVSLSAMRDWAIERSEYGLQYALFIMLMVIAIPVAWIHYATILILPMLLLLNHYRTQELSLTRSLIVIVSYGLIAFGDQRSFNYMYDVGVVTLFLSSYKFYGMALLTGLLVYEVWQGHVSWGAQWLALGRRLRQR